MGRATGRGTGSGHWQTVLLLPQFLQVLPREADWLRTRKADALALEETCDLSAQAWEEVLLHPLARRIDVRDHHCRAVDIALGEIPCCVPLSSMQGD